MTIEFVTVDTIAYSALSFETDAVCMTFKVAQDAIIRRFIRGFFIDYIPSDGREVTRKCISLSKIIVYRFLIAFLGTAVNH